MESRRLRRIARTTARAEALDHHLMLHLQQAREARAVYADNIYHAQTHAETASWALDAADQAKHHCPLLGLTSRRTGQMHKLVQQFIGVLDHAAGYILYRFWAG